MEDEISNRFVDDKNYIMNLCEFLSKEKEPILYEKVNSNLNSLKFNQLFFDTFKKKEKLPLISDKKILISFLDFFYNKIQNFDIQKRPIEEIIIIPKIYKDFSKNIFSLFLSNDFDFKDIEKYLYDFNFFRSFFETLKSYFSNANFDVIFKALFKNLLEKVFKENFLLFVEFKKIFVNDLISQFRLIKNNEQDLLDKSDLDYCDGLIENIKSVLECVENKNENMYKEFKEYVFKCFICFDVDLLGKYNKKFFEEIDKESEDENANENLDEEKIVRKIKKRQKILEKNFDDDDEILNKKDKKDKKEKNENNKNVDVKNKNENDENSKNNKKKEESKNDNKKEKKLLKKNEIEKKRNKIEIKNPKQVSSTKNKKKEEKTTENKIQNSKEEKKEKFLQNKRNRSLSSSSKESNESKIKTRNQKKQEKKNKQLNKSISSKSSSNYSKNEEFEEEEEIEEKQTKKNKKLKKIKNKKINSENKSTPEKLLKKIPPKSIMKKNNSENNSLNSSKLSNQKSNKRNSSNSSSKSLSNSKQNSSEKKKNFYQDLNEKYSKEKNTFKSPSKFNLTPMKTKKIVNKNERERSREKSNEKKVKFKDEKKNLFDDNKKNKNISFNNDRFVKEFDPKTPVRDVKKRGIRKSPLEKKK